MFYVEYKDYNEDPNGMNKTSDFCDTYDEAEVQAEALKEFAYYKNVRIVEQ